MRITILAIVAFAMAPIPAAAAVMLRVAPASAPPCYSSLPACDRSISGPLRDSNTDGTWSDPAVAAIVGLAILGAALGRRRSGLPEVVS